MHKSAKLFIAFDLGFAMAKEGLGYLACTGLSLSAEKFAQHDGLVYLRHPHLVLDEA